MWPQRSAARLLATRRCSTAAAAAKPTGNRAKPSGLSAAQEIGSHLLPVNRGALARDVASAGALTSNPNPNPDPDANPNPDPDPDPDPGPHEVR